MLHKIMKPNGHVLYKTSSHQLNPDKEKDPVMVRHMNAYDIIMNKKLGR
jgi:hypothetical protein